MQLPGANAGKPDVAGAAKQAVKKSPLGFMNVGDFAFDLPGSNVSKDDLPNNVKPLEAKGLKDAPPNKAPSLPPLPQVSQQICVTNMAALLVKVGAEIYSFLQNSLVSACRHKACYKGKCLKL